MRALPVASTFAAVVTLALTGQHPAARPVAPEAEIAVSSIAPLRNMIIPGGTPIAVALATPVSSETAMPGDIWIGSTRRAVVVQGALAIPAHSAVSGIVAAARASRARAPDVDAVLELELESIAIGDHSYRAHGGMDPIVTGESSGGGGPSLEGARFGRSRITLAAGAALGFTLSQPIAIRP